MPTCIGSKLTALGVRSATRRSFLRLQDKRETRPVMFNCLGTVGCGDMEERMEVHVCLRVCVCVCMSGVGSGWVGLCVCWGEVLFLFLRDSCFLCSPPVHLCLRFLYSNVLGVGRVLQAIGYLFLSAACTPGYRV